MSIFDDNIVKDDTNILIDLITSKESFINESDTIIKLIQELFEDFTQFLEPIHDDYYMLINYYNDNSIYYITLYDGSKVIDIGFDICVKFEHWEIKVNPHRDVFDDANNANFNPIFKRIRVPKIKNIRVFKINKDFFNKIYEKIK